MKLTKRLLEAINSGVRMGLELRDDEDTLRDIDFNKTIINKSTNDISSGANAYIYSKELQEMLSDPMAINKKFIKLALKYNKEYGATYNPHLDEKDFKEFIKKCIDIQGNEANLNWIDTSDVTNMYYLFLRTDFHGNISKWNVSNVNNMEGTFRGATHFNSDVSNWDVSNVENMTETFSHCYEFNQNLSKWDVSNVKRMDFMFDQCLQFNGKGLENWDVSSVKDMCAMFRNCTSFNGNISKWDISNVKDMEEMFEECVEFNQNLSEWDISSKNIRGIFNKCHIKTSMMPKRIIL